MTPCQQGDANRPSPDEHRKHPAESRQRADNPKHPPLLVFFVFALIAYVIVRGLEMRRKPLE